MTALETLKNVIKAAEEGNDLDEKAGLQAISDIKKQCFEKNVYNIQAASQLDSSVLVEARTFHELCVFFFVWKKNYKEFEKNYFRVQYFYKDLSDFIDGDSDNYHTIQALYLLYLLSFNRIEDFHLYLSSIPVEEHSNPLYSYSINLERDITVGNYLSPVNSHDNAPSKYFQIFYERIFETIRYEIFRSLEASVEEITIMDIIRILRLKDENVLVEALEKEKENSLKRGFEWILEGSIIEKIEKNINANEVIMKMLSYGHEIEALN